MGKRGYLHDTDLYVKPKRLGWSGGDKGKSLQSSAFLVSTSMEISLAILREEYIKMCIHSIKSLFCHLKELCSNLVNTFYMSEVKPQKILYL